MFVTVSLQNYRNIKELSLKDLGSNIVISGSNGQGKSNLLEAIFLSTTGRSFRPMNNLSETIGVEGEFNRIEMISENEDILEMIVSLHDSRLSRKYTLNTKKRSIGTITSKFPVLLFAPHSVDLVSNEPGTRRDDLDSFLVSLSTDYRHAYERYIKVLKNRNALLKAIREQKATRAELGYWTEELINLAGKIYEHRDGFFTAIRPFISQAASKLYGQKSEKDFSIRYIPASVGDIRDGIQDNIQDNMQDSTYESKQKEKYINVLSNKFADNLEKEIIVGKTLYGPHKDDYELTLKGRNLRYQGSRGQQRLGALLLKLAEWEYMHDTTGKEGLFLIDDLMSELDPEHREETARYLISAPFQFLLTTADKREIPKILIKESTCFEF